MIDADIAAQVLGNNATSQTGISIDPDIAAKVLSPDNNISKTQSFFAGAGQQLANIGENLATTVAAGTDKIGLTNNAQQGIKDAFASTVHPFYKQYTQANPGSALAGNVAGGVLGSAPALLNAPGKLYQGTTGAITGYLNSDPNASALEKTKNAAIGAGLNMVPGGPALAATGGAVLGGGTAYLAGEDVGTGAIAGAGTGLAIYGAGKYGRNIPYVTQPISNIIKGIKPNATSPSDLAEIATQRTLEKVGGDMSKTTPEMALKELDKLTNAARIQKDSLYNARNAQAAAEGITLNFDDLKDDILFYARGKNFTQTRQGTDLIEKINKGENLSYAESQDLVKLIGGNANTAKRQGDKILSTELGTLKDDLLAKIDQSGRSAELDALHTGATNFYKNVYVPLRNADAAKILAERQAEGSYISNAVRSLLNDKQLYGAFAAGNKAGLKNNMEQTIAAAHINALKDAATTDGMINPTKYGNALAATLRDNPIPLQPVADKIQALGKALEVAKQGQGLRGQLSQHSIKQTIGMSALGLGAGGTGFALGGPVVAAVTAGASFLLPKTKYLYTAGKMMKNPETAALLGRAAKITDKTDPSVANFIYKQVADKFEKYNSYMSPRLLTILNATSSEEAPQQ